MKYNTLDAVAKWLGDPDASGETQVRFLPASHMQKSVPDFLSELLTKSGHYKLNPDDTALLEQNGINEFIYSKLTSKKFRKFKMDEACIVRTKNAIHLRTENNEPINIVYPQGGYKLWRLPSSPTVDWAEYFNISYVLEYVASIAAAYKPGVHIVYFMHTLLMELHDNLTVDEIQDYVDSFENLLQEFRKYLPANISISILRDADLYTRDEYFKALENGKTRAEEKYKTWDEKQKIRYAKMSELNIKWNGKEDWTKLSKTEKGEKIYLAALYETAAMSELTRINEKVKSANIVLVFTKGTPAFIGIGSTKASMAKFWVGFGVLQIKDDSFLPIILTPSQYTDALKSDYENIPVNLINHTNFNEILLFKKPFDFSKPK